MRSSRWKLLILTNNSNKLWKQCIIFAFIVSLTQVFFISVSIKKIYVIFILNFYTDTTLLGCALSYLA